MKSLRSRMMFFLGGLVIVLMVLISLSILFYGKRLILDNHRQNAMAIGRTFSLSLLDALILQESGRLPHDGIIENLIHNFIQKNQVRYVVLYDATYRIGLRSSLIGEDVLPDFWTRALRHGQTVIRLERHPSLGWVLEATLPLRIYSRSWGALTIGFDAESIRTKLQHLFFLLFSLTGASVLIIWVVIYLFTQHLTRPLRLLVEEMNGFDFNNIRPSAIPCRDDEMGCLVENFEKLKNRLAQSRGQLLAAQRQIYHAEKLASIGRLAAGVAHEINNPLQGLKNCLYRVEQEQKKEQRKKYLQLADESLDHIADIIQKLLNFARQKPKQTTVVDIAQELDKVLTLLHYRIQKQGVCLTKTIAPDLPLIQADAQLVQEVFMNLLLNSLDALEERQGAIEINARRLDEQHIEIRVHDTGSGIEPQHLDNIYDPFFTTKEEGKGTGLGLSVVLGIVESHGGHIRVESTVGRGTTFIVVLPIGDLSAERSE